jgi:hypothetical protein
MPGTVHLLTVLLLSEDKEVEFGIGRLSLTDSVVLDGYKVMLVTKMLVTLFDNEMGVRILTVTRLLEAMGVAGDSMLLLEVGFFGGAFGRFGLIEDTASISTAEDGRVVLKELDDGSTWDSIDCEVYNPRNRQNLRSVRC